MPRLTNAILNNNQGHARGYQNEMVDLRFGGQEGYSLELAEYVSNQQHVRKNLICLLVDYPRAFDLYPDKTLRIATLRALLEQHSKVIDGLNATLEVEYAETPVGGNGAMQTDVTDVKQTQSDISFTWDEKYGRSVSRFFYNYIVELIMDPQSKIPTIATRDGGVPAYLGLKDAHSFTCAFIEPSPMHDKVVQSWLVTDMKPRSSGELTGRKELAAAGEPIQHNIRFTGVQQYGKGVDAYCQELLNSVRIAGANPNTRVAFLKETSQNMGNGANIHPEISKTNNTTGYGKGVAVAAATSLRV